MITHIRGDDQGALGGRLQGTCVAGASASLGGADSQRPERARRSDPRVCSLTDLQVASRHSPSMGRQYPPGDTQNPRREILLWSCGWAPPVVFGCPGNPNATRRRPRRHQTTNAARSRACGGPRASPPPHPRLRCAAGPGRGPAGSGAGRRAGRRCRWLEGERSATHGTALGVAAPRGACRLPLNTAPRRW